MKGENSYTETLAKIQVGAIFHMRTRFLQVMENLESHGFKNFILQAWRVIEFNGRSLKVVENQSFVWLLLGILRTTKARAM